MLISLAWRNIWRNKRRTLVTVSALSLGVAAIAFIHSYRESTYAILVQQITAGLVGDVQIHGKGYQADPEISTVVREPALVEARLKTALPGASPMRRVVGYVLAGSAEASSAALVVGLEPDRERTMEALFAVESGRNLGSAPHKEVAIGRELAQQLSVRPGSELVLVGQGADGSVANDRFTVVGLVDAGSAEMNASAVFLHIVDAQDFFALGDGVNQIIVRLRVTEEDVSAPVAALRSALDLKTLEVLGWNEILPEIKATMEQKRKQQHIIDVVVILIVGLGVLNAMTMATFERTRELGVLAALGTRRRRVLALIVTEALLQGAVGCLAGIVLAVGILYGIGTVHLGTLSQSDILGVRFPQVIYLHVQWQGLVSAATTAFLTVIAGGLWPAIRASRLKPVEAIRHV
jgi:putative ABC transport system permease protein